MRIENMDVDGCAISSIAFSRIVCSSLSGMSGLRRSSPVVGRCSGFFLQHHTTRSAASFDTSYMRAGSVSVSRSFVMRTRRSIPVENRYIISNRMIPRLYRSTFWL